MICNHCRKKINENGDYRMFRLETIAVRDHARNWSVSRDFCSVSCMFRYFRGDHYQQGAQEDSE